MRGVKLQFNDEIITGALEKGSFGITMSNKNGAFRFYFGGIDKDDNFHTWYATDMKDSDAVTICYEDVTIVSPSESIHYTNNSVDINKSCLESYYNLKKELIEEGILKDECSNFGQDTKSDCESGV